MSYRNIKLIKPILFSILTLALCANSFSQVIEIRGNTTTPLLIDSTATNTPGATDSTDFGVVFVGDSNTVIYSITNKNAIDPNLIIYGYSITGTDAAMFSVSTEASTPIAGAASSNAFIRFKPTSAGLKTATLFVFTNGSANPYKFNIEGTGSENEIEVQGGLTIEIVDGDNIPSTLDDTDFGGSTIGTPVPHTFTILNTNSGPNLNITSVTTSGVNAAEFVVSAITTPAVIGASSSTTFVVTFTPAATGVRFAEVTIVNDDLNEDPYNFTIQGNGLTSREIDVQGNTITIVDGDNTPTTSDDTDFGSISAAAGTIVKTFTIENTGGQDLTINNIVVGGTHSADFSLTSVHTFSETVSGTSSMTFDITFDPSATGLRQANITITNDDASEAVYNFDIQGTGTAASEYTMSSGTSGATYTDCNATIFDDGGPNAVYTASADYSYTIAPTDAKYVAITFASFDVEDGPGFSCGYDYLDVDYGATTIRYCNNNVPALNTPIYGDANSNIVLTWHSDINDQRNGFELQWEGIISSNIISADVNCNGAADGSITIGAGAGAGNGTPTYTYQINNGGYGATTTFNNLTPTTHIVSIKDFNGCHFDSSVVITEPAALVIGERHQDESCAGNADGHVVITGTGGTGSYQYSFNNATFQNATDSMYGIGSGLYPIEIRDANLCEDSSFVNFNIGGSGLPTGPATLSGDQHYCFQDSTIKSYTYTGVTGEDVITWTFVAFNGSPNPVITAGQNTSTLLLQMAGVTDSILLIAEASNACGSLTPDSLLLYKSDFLPPVEFDMNPKTINLGANNVSLVSTVSEAGGTFGGPGVISASNVFSPSIAGTGSHQLSYDIDDPNGCRHILTDVVTVVTSAGVVVVAPTMCFDGALENVSADPDDAFNIISVIGFDVDGNTGLVVDANPTGDSIAQINPSMLTDGFHALNFRFVSQVTYQFINGIKMCSGPFGISYPCGFTYGTGTINTTQAITQAFYLDSIGGVNIVSSADSACDDQGTLVNFVAQYYHNQGIGVWTSAVSPPAWNEVNSTFATVNPSLAGAGTYPISYEYTSNAEGSGCKANDATVFKVNAIPNPWFGLDRYYSEQNNPVPTNPTPDASGFYAGAGMVGTDFWATIASAGTHNIVYNYTDPATGCTNVYWDTTTVIANTGSIDSLAATYCYEDLPDTIYGDANQGGLFGGVTGRFSFSGNPAALDSIGLDTAVFYPTLAGPGNHTITYSYVDQDTFYVNQNVYVDSIGPVYFTGLNAAHSYCVVEPQFQMNGQFTHPSGSGDFTFDGKASSFINTGNSAFLTPDSVGTWNITYTYTSTLSGCTADSTETIVIHELPPLNFTLSSNYCSNDSNLTIVGNPRGGDFSSSAALLNVFSTLDSMLLSPSNTQIGANIVTYNYTDIYGCSNSIDSNFTLHQAPDVQIDNDTVFSDYCELTGSHPISGLINSSIATDGYFWGPGVADIDSTDGRAIFHPDTAGVGTGYVLHYYYVDGNNCYGEDSMFVQVNALPIVTISGLTPSKEYCNNHDIIGNPIQFTGAPPITSGISGLFTLDGVPASTDQVTFDPTAYPLNVLAVVPMSYTFTDNKGCINTAVDTVYVNPAAHPDFSISGICIVDTIDLTDLTVPSPDGLQFWKWTIDNDTTYSTQHAKHKFAVHGNHSFNLEITTVAGCVSDTTAVIEFGDKPTADFYWINECFDPLVPIMYFDSSSTVSLLDTLSYSWDMGDLVGTSQAKDTNYFYATPGDYIVDLVISTTFNCIDTMSKLVSVKPMITSYPYFTDFQAGPDSWTAKTFIDFDTLNNWAHSTWVKDPSPTNLSWSTSHVIDSSDYNSLERTYVSSPCFDFTTLKKPMIRFDMWRDFADIGDGAVLESSIDNGQTWQVIGSEQSTDAGINWYNQVVINNGDGPGGTVLGGQPLGWSDVVDAGWVEVRHDLDHLVGNAKVIFRVAFSTNGAGEFKGFAFDDVWIGERSKYVLVEHFTNTECLPCVITSTSLNPFITEYSKDLIDIQYHTNALTGDKLFIDYQAGPSARSFFYGASQIPQTVTDGNIINNYTGAWVADSLITRRRALTSAIFDLDLVKTTSTNSYTVDARLEINENFSNDIDVYMAVIEKQVTAAGLGGVGNTELAFNNVVKAMLPNAGGTRIAQTWVPGDTMVISQTWNTSNAVFYDAGLNDDIEIVVFIQDAVTKEVYQTATTDTSFINIALGVEDTDAAEVAKVNFNFNLYPNPTSGDLFIMFNQDLAADA